MKKLLLLAMLLLSACGQYDEYYTDCEMVEDRIMCDEDYMVDYNDS